MHVAIATEMMIVYAHVLTMIRCGFLNVLFTGTNEDGVGLERTITLLQAQANVA